MGVRENKVETYLKNSVKSLGGLTRKWVSPGHNGVPDQIIILNGSVFFVEVKTVDGTLDLWQEREHERLIKMGANVSTVYGEKGVDQLINDIKIHGRPWNRYFR